MGDGDDAKQERGLLGRVVVVGVGGGGCHAVAHMASQWREGPELVAVHTDVQTLNSCQGVRRVQIGATVVGGLSTSGDAAQGKRSAEVDTRHLTELFTGADLVFFVTGLGGGTGTGGTPVLAKLARSAGAMTLCFATLPFEFEGDQRRRQAEEGLRELRRAADVVIALPNEGLFSLIEDSTSLTNAFAKVNETMAVCIRAIWSLLVQTGVINLDFSDFRGLMADAGGTCAMAHAAVTGRDRASAAVKEVLASPFFDAGKAIANAAGLLVGIVGGEDLTLVEIQQVMKGMRSLASPRARVVMGTAIDDTCRGRLSLTVLATRSEEDAPAAATSPGDTSTRLLEKARSKDQAGKKRTKRAKQTRLELEPQSKGRFKDVEPTYYDGEDLDIPTFVRRGIKLARG